MGVAEELQKLRQSEAGCRLVAFADIDAQLVLVSDSAETARRETLDSLCASATRIFEASQTGTGDVLTGADTAVEVAGSEMQIFLRNTADPTDVICCICAADTDAVQFITTARQALNDIASEGGDAS